MAQKYSTTKRVCLHPRRTSRQMRALERREAQILRMEAGMLPTAKEWLPTEHFEMKHGNPGVKINKAKAEVETLRRKLNLVSHG